MRRDPNDYDVVVVGTPVWNASVSAPVRTFLAANGRRFKNCAFFATQGGRGAPRAFRQMRELVVRRPMTTLILTEREVKHHDLVSSVASFVRQIETGTETSKAPGVHAVAEQGSQAGSSR
jgi:NAD(P)H-dependent FMN reductase